MYAIGLDIGTTSVCGILHDAVSGEVVATHTKKNDSFLSSADPEKRGSIEGIGIDNLTMFSFCDGFMCGMASELYAMYREILPFLTASKKLMVGSGNGVRFNTPLKERFEQIFGLPLRIPVHKEEAAFGASLYALVAAGVYPDMASAQRLIRYQ